MRNDHEILEKYVGYNFRDKGLIKPALVHPSFRHENPPLQEDNQRLEFLGDAALDLVAAEYLYQHYNFDEGAMTKMRSSLTCTTRLCEMARAIELGDFLQLGRGEISANGADRESTLADALEALIGAAFIDGGIEAVRKIFVKIFVPHIDAASGIELQNPKGMLQEICQRMGKCVPNYRILRESGPAHDKEFTVGVSVDGEEVATGRAPSISKAERAAAIKALKVFERCNPQNPE